MKYFVKMWNALRRFFSVPETSSSQSTTERTPDGRLPIPQLAGSDIPAEGVCGWRADAERNGSFSFTCYCGQHKTDMMPTTTSDGTLSPTPHSFAGPAEGEGVQVATLRVKPLNSRERKEKAQAEKLAMPHRRQVAEPETKEVQ